MLLLVVSKFASICKPLFCFFGCSPSLTLTLSVVFSFRLLSLTSFLKPLYIYFLFKPLFNQFFQSRR
uniref:Uncharacterized protein n=1 Tax=Salix viminalis TaxID=40686 RepID=A0A6N2KZP2_SALVM